MTATSLKERLQRGEPVLGTIMPLPSPEVAEIAGLAGYDFLLLDMEHGPVTPHVLEGLVRACRAFNVPALARVPEDHPKTILRALDVGCVGVMVPQIESPQQAAAAVAATKYAPAGTRSLAGATAAAVSGARWARIAWSAGAPCVASAAWSREACRRSRSSWATEQPSSSRARPGC